MAADPYDEWKDAGKPGGSYSAWLAQRNTPAAPAPTPAATPAPSATPVGAPQEITEQNRQTANMTPQQRAAWAAQNINSFDAQSRQAGGGPGMTREQAEAQWLAWDKHYDASCPPNIPYRDRTGGCNESPDNCPEGTTLHGSQCIPHSQLPDWAGGSGGSGGQGGGGGEWTPAPPPPPTTFGSQLSLTGNALQDMLLQQFNTGQDPSTNQANIFGLGEDARVGGTGRNADQGTTAPTRQGQSLSGGGLWWGQDKDTFSGFDASQKNAEGTMTASPAAKAPAATPATPAPAAVSAPQPAAQAGRMGGMFRATRKPTPLAGMVQTQFSNPARTQASYF